MGLPVWTVLHEPGEVGEMGAEAEDPFVVVQPERRLAELGQVPGINKHTLMGFMLVWRGRM